MAPLYDLTGHPLLQGDAQRLAPATLASATEVAESLLGIVTPANAKLGNALALQVSFMARQGFVDAAAMASEGRGSRSVSWRDVSILPQAQQIVDGVNIDSMNTVRTLRPVQATTGSLVPLVGARDIVLRNPEEV